MPAPRRAAVLGSPIAHSLSPVLHRAAYAALGVLTGMVQRFDQEATAVDLPAAARQVHLTEGQVIIMASMVQAEGGRLSDYPKIARVIYHRLAHGIPLQLDSTVLYGDGLARSLLLARMPNLFSP